MSWFLRGPEGIHPAFPATCPDTSWDKLPLGNLSLLCLKTTVIAFEGLASHADIKHTHSSLSELKALTSQERGKLSPFSFTTFLIKAFPGAITFRAITYINCKTTEDQESLQGQAHIHFFSVFLLCDLTGFSFHFSCLQSRGYKQGKSSCPEILEFGISFTPFTSLLLYPLINNSKHSHSTAVRHQFSHKHGHTYSSFSTAEGLAFKNQPKLGPSTKAAFALHGY